MQEHGLDLAAANVDPAFSDLDADLRRLEREQGEQLGIAVPLQVIHVAPLQVGDLLNVVHALQQGSSSIAGHLILPDCRDGMRPEPSARLTYRAR